MRRMVVLLTVMALMVVMLAMGVAPAFAARFPVLGPGPVNSCKASIASESAPFCPGLDHLGQ
jgi:disulfide bond formation protein DsbB